jgi:hypothetical protein
MWLICKGKPQIVKASHAIIYLRLLLALIIGEVSLTAPRPSRLLHPYLTKPNNSRAYPPFQLRACISRLRLCTHDSRHRRAATHQLAIASHDRCPHLPTIDLSCTFDLYTLEIRIGEHQEYNTWVAQCSQEHGEGQRCPTAWPGEVVERSWPG